MSNRMIIHQDETFYLRERIHQLAVERSAWAWVATSLLAAIICMLAGLYTYSAFLTKTWLYVGAGGAVLWMGAAIGFVLLPYIHAANRRALEASEDEGEDIPA